MNIAPACAVSQKEQIHDHLKKRGKITSLEALVLFGCFRLSARIWDLRREGVPIPPHVMIDVNGKKVAEFHLMNFDENGQLTLF